MSKGQTAPSGVMPTVTELIGRITSIESEIGDWLPPEWVATHGPRFDTVRNAMILMWRSWYALVASVRKSDATFNIEDIRDALIDLAAAATKTAVDIGHMAGSGSPHEVVSVLCSSREPSYEFAEEADKIA